MCYCSTQQKSIDKKQLVNCNCQYSLTNTCINDVSVSSSNNSSLLNTTPVEFSPSPQSTSTPPNPLVAAGIIPATVYNSIIPARKEKKKKKATSKYTGKTHYQWWTDRPIWRKNLKRKRRKRTQKEERKHKRKNH